MHHHLTSHSPCCAAGLLEQQSPHPRGAAPRTDAPRDSLRPSPLIVESTGRQRVCGRCCSC